MTGQQAAWRRYQRMVPPPDAPVRVVMDECSDAVLKVRDLSEDGMELEFSGLETVHIDDYFQLAIHLPLEAPISAVVRVRHLARTHFGVTFVDLEPRHKQAVRRYIQRFKFRPGLWKRLRQLWLA